MGSIVVYRYRPMRLVPTITTRVVIATGSLMLKRTLWAVVTGVNSQLKCKCNQNVAYLGVLLRGYVVRRNIRENGWRISARILILCQNPAKRCH